jgi:hypothetical protein
MAISRIINSKDFHNSRFNFFVPFDPNKGGLERPYQNNKIAIVSRMAKMHSRNSEKKQNERSLDLMENCVYGTSALRIDKKGLFNSRSEIRI